MRDTLDDTRDHSFQIGEKVPYLCMRGTLADLPQCIGGDHRRDDPELDLGEGEDGTLVSECNVGGGDEAGAAAEGMTLNEGDHRCGARVDRVEHASERVGICDVLVVGEGGRPAHPFDVCAGAEARPFASEDDGARLADVDECLRKPGHERLVEGVPRLGPGQGDTEDIVVPLDPQRIHCTAV